MATIRLNLVSVNHKPVNPKICVVQTNPRGSKREKSENRIETRIISMIDWKINHQRTIRK